MGKDLLEVISIDKDFDSFSIEKRRLIGLPYTQTFDRYPLKRRRLVFLYKILPTDLLPMQELLGPVQAHDFCPVSQGGETFNDTFMSKRSLRSIFMRLLLTTSLLKHFSFCVFCKEYNSYRPSIESL